MIKLYHWFPDIYVKNASFKDKKKQLSEQSICESAALISNSCRCTFEPHIKQGDELKQVKTIPDFERQLENAILLDLWQMDS